MKKILNICILLAVICFVGQSCEQDPAYQFQDDGKIYFKYPKKINAFGVETNIQLDSILYSLADKPDDLEKDTLWIKMQIMGERKDIERQYKIVAVADSSSAKEGLDFETLPEIYTFHSNVGIDSFPLILKPQSFKKVFCRNVLLKLEATPDLGIAFVEYSTILINFSAYPLEPDWWGMGFGYTLGAYHPLVYDKVVEIYGSKEVDIYGNHPYCTYVGNVVRTWFEENVVIDPFTGERLVL
ncbi:MAG: DUF4843 domain-containing protein [Odoribacter sp.]